MPGADGIGALFILCFSLTFLLLAAALVIYLGFWVVLVALPGLVSYSAAYWLGSRLFSEPIGVALGVVVTVAVYAVLIRLKLRALYAEGTQSSYGQ